jgi:hypothetical protein
LEEATLTFTSLVSCFADVGPKTTRDGSSRPADMRKRERLPQQSSKSFQYLKFSRTQ